MGKTHKKVAKRFGRGRRGKEKKKGIDFPMEKQVNEVAVTESDIYSSVKQIQRAKKKRKAFIVTISKKVPLARKATKGTGIGIKLPSGKIVKRSRRLKKRKT